MDDRHLRADAREVERVAHGGVPAADDRDRLALVEGAVADCAPGDAAARELGLGLEPEFARGGARRHDQRDGFDAPADHAVDGDARLGAGDAGHLVHLEPGAEPLRLALHARHELVGVDAVGEAGEVLDDLGLRELAAGLHAFEHERLEPGARRVDRRGEPRRSAARDDDLLHVV